jgi:hypothetical protein
MDANGTAPTDAQMLAAMIQWQADATLARQAIGCCLSSMRDARTISRFLIGSTVAVPEQGQCAGLTITAQVAVPHCVCPPG